MTKSQNYDKEKAERKYNEIINQVSPLLASHPMFKIEFMKACEQASLITGVDEYSISIFGNEIEIAYAGKDFFKGYDTAFKTTLRAHSYNHNGEIENYLTKELYVSKYNEEQENSINSKNNSYDVNFYISSYDSAGIRVAEQECLLSGKQVSYGAPGHQTIRLDEPTFSMTQPPQARFASDNINFNQKYRMPNNYGLICVNENNQQEYYYISEIQGYDAWGYNPNEKYAKDAEGNVYRLDGQNSEYNGMSFEEFSEEVKKQFRSEVEQHQMFATEEKTNNLGYVGQQQYEGLTKIIQLEENQSFTR